MKIKFIDINRKLVMSVRQAVRYHKLPIEVHQGNIFDYRGLVVSASNPHFTMGGGLDALIAKNFPKEVRQIKKRKGNQRIGDVIFAITVDDQLKANFQLVEKAIRFAISKTKKDETLLLSGLGTGIGGLSFADLLKVLQNVFGSKVAVKKTVKRSTKLVEPKGVLRWKFLREGMKSEYGGCVWEVGELKSINSQPILCQKGFHCSKKIWHAFEYVKGEVLAQVEVSGRVAKDPNGTKEAWEKMRFIKAYKWQKKDSVELAIFAVEQVIDIFEKKYPKDDRPRKAIEAAKKWCERPTDANAAAAADAAYAAAYAAADAAYAAAYDAADAAAYAAAYAAADAAYAAAYDAADAAARAADAAARNKFVDRIVKWMEDHVSKLEEIK